LCRCTPIQFVGDSLQGSHYYANSRATNGNIRNTPTMIGSPATNTLDRRLIPQCGTVWWACENNLNCSIIEGYVKRYVISSRLCSQAKHFRIQKYEVCLALLSEKRRSRPLLLMTSMSLLSQLDRLQHTTLWRIPQVQRHSAFPHQLQGRCTPPARNAVLFETYKHGCTVKE